MQPIRHRKLIHASVGVAFVAVGAVWLATDRQSARAMSPAQREPAATLADQPAPGAVVSAVPPAAMPRPARLVSFAKETPMTPAPALATPKASEASPDEVEARRDRARVELERLQRQDPESFLAVFDFIDSERGSVEEIQPLRLITARYITGRSAILRRMHARFIDDPDADHSLELGELERLALEFRRELDWYAQKVPDVGNFDEILHTTTLRLPSFLASSDEAYPEKEPIVLDGPETEPVPVEPSEL